MGDFKVVQSAHLEVEAISSGTQTVVAGDYMITSSSADIWVVDWCAEIGEAIGGILASLGLVVIAGIVFLISSILCCVGCCCCGPEKGSRRPAEQSSASLCRGARWQA